MDDLSCFVFDLGFIPPDHWGDRHAGVLTGAGWVDAGEVAPRLHRYRYGAAVLDVDVTGVGRIRVPANRDAETLLGPLFAATARKRRHAMRGVALLERAIDVNAREARKADDVASTLLSLLEGQTQRLASDVMKGVFSYRSHNHLMLQKARIVSIAASPLLADADVRRVEAMKALLDAADLRLDAWVLNSDVFSRSMTNLLVFVVSVATIIPVAQSADTWAGDYRVLGTIAVLIVIFALSIPRK